MKFFYCQLGKLLFGFASILAVLGIAGCATDSMNSPKGESAGSPNAAASAQHLGNDPLRIGDKIHIDFASNLPQPIPFVETEIKGDGTISLNLIGRVDAVGKTPGELEAEIQKKYVPNWYANLSVSVTPVLRFFYVTGQVNASQSSTGGRIMYSGPITVTQAITAAGDFTPYAKKSNILLTRADGKTQYTINWNKAIKNRDKDLAVYPGDTIYVDRRFW